MKIVNVYIIFVLLLFVRFFCVEGLHANDQVIMECKKVISNNLNKNSSDEVKGYWYGLISSEFSNIKPDVITDESLQKIISDFQEYFEYIGASKYNLDSDQKDEFAKRVKGAVVNINKNRELDLGLEEYKNISQKIKNLCLDYSNFVVNEIKNKKISRIKTSLDFFQHFMDGLQSMAQTQPLLPGKKINLGSDEPFKNMYSEIFINFIGLYVYINTLKATQSDLVSMRNIFLLYDESYSPIVKEKLSGFNRVELLKNIKTKISPLFNGEEFTFNPYHFCLSLFLFKDPNSKEVDKLLNFNISTVFTLHVDKSFAEKE